MSEMLAGKKVLITGASGFIGSHMVKHLIRYGSSVHIITRTSSDLSILGSDISKVTNHRYDGNPEQINEIVSKVQPDLVYHFAAYYVAEHTTEDIVKLMDSNLKFGTHLADAMVKNNIFNLINTGTAWQHYNSDTYNPVCLYAATKQAFEDILEFYVQAFGLNVITLKIFDTYGPNDRRNKLFSLLQNAPSGSTLSMSPGGQLVDFVYIDDVTKAFIMAGERLIVGITIGHERFAVTSGSPLKLKDIVSLYLKVTNKHLSIEWGGRDYRKREVMLPWSQGDILPGWKPQVSLIEGIELI